MSDAAKPAEIRTAEQMLDAVDAEIRAFRQRGKTGTVRDELFYMLQEQIRALRSRLAPPAPAAPPFPPPRYDEVYAEGTRRLFEENEPQPPSPPPTSDAQEAGELAKRMRFALSPGGLLIQGEVARLFEAALPHVEAAAAQQSKLYNKTFGDDRKCTCGHPYYRHFDTYDDMAPVGCKYCQCSSFVEATAARASREPEYVEPHAPDTGVWPPPAPSRAPQGDETPTTEALVERLRNRVALAYRAKDTLGYKSIGEDEVMFEQCLAALLATPPSAGGEDRYSCRYGHVHRGKGSAASCLGDAPGRQPEELCAWLIERTDRGEPWYWSGTSPLSFTQTIDEAVRFVDERFARRVKNRLIEDGREHCKVTEHLWIPAARQPQARKGEVG